VYIGAGRQPNQACPAKTKKAKPHMKNSNPQRLADLRRKRREIRRQIRTIEKQMEQLHGLKH